MLTTRFSLLGALFSLFVSCSGGNETPQPTPPIAPSLPEKVAFAHGADISWYTEMAANGRKFYNTQGQEREAPALMRELGMNAVRLRVWVNPENKGVNFCNTADVVRKAKAAQSAGLAVMIDFHYSDWWADPGRQEIPKAWQGHAFSELEKDVRRHTTDVLTAVKQAGVTPQWVQVGNETNNGMLGEMGTAQKPAQYAALFRTGCEAAKSVFPNVLVVVHLAKGYDSGLFKWNLDLLRNNGAKFDLIGMSIYPTEHRYWENGAWKQQSFWSETRRQQVVLHSGSELIDAAMENMTFVAQRYGCKVLVSECGMPLSTPAESKQWFEQLYHATKASSHCAGWFYWEPLADGRWRPASYAQWNWGAYDMGAFTPEGRPTPLFDVLKP